MCIQYWTILCFCYNTFMVKHFEEIPSQRIQCCRIENAVDFFQVLLKHVFFPWLQVRIVTVFSLGRIQVLHYRKNENASAVGFDMNGCLHRHANGHFPWVSQMEIFHGFMIICWANHGHTKVVTWFCLLCHITSCTYNISWTHMWWLLKYCHLSCR